MLRFSSKRIIWNGLILAALALIALVSCTGTGPAADATPGVPETGQNIIEVDETEYQISMPASITAGQVVFRVTNTGSEEHNFEIEGQGIEEEFETNLQPGETRDLEVNLPPGTYEVYCPVGNHADEGMRLELTVTETGGAQ